MDDRTRKAKPRRHEERARNRRKLAELEEAEARNRRLIDELRKNGELFSSIADSATDAIIALDEQGTIHYMNRAAEHLFGYTSAEVEGRILHDFLIPERFREHSLKSFELMHARQDKSVMGTTREFTALTRYGEELPVEVSISSYDMEGKTRYVTICRDISERKKIEQALRESEERYRRLVENLNDVVFNLDPLGRISYISPAIESISSYKPEDMVGQSFTHYVHPDDMPYMLEEFERTLAGRPGPAEFRIVDKDGGVLHVRTSSRPQYKDGELTGLTGVLTDITEQKEAEGELEDYRLHLENLVEERTRELREAADRLRRSENYYRSLIRNAPDMIDVLNEDLTLRWGSPSAGRITGYEPEEVYGRSILDFIHSDDVEKARALAERVLQNPGETHSVVVRFRHDDGSYRFHETIATNLLDEPAVRGIVINSRDVTEREQAEEALRESEEMYRTLVLISPDAVSVSDMEGLFTYVSPQTLVLHGYESDDELLRKSSFELIAPEDRARAMSIFAAVLKEGFVRNVEGILLRKDGTRFVGELSAALLRDANGNPHSVVAYTRDITERKRAEERLRRLNESFLKLGADPIENLQILALNCKEILDADLVRYGRMEKGAFHVFSSLRPDDGFVEHEEMEEYIYHHLRADSTGKIITSEELGGAVFERDPDVRRNSLKSGLLYPVRMHGEYIGNLCVFSREKRVFTQAEKETLATLGRAISIEEERRAFNESMRDFVDIASHELRHPVALLAGYAETLEEHGAEMDERTRSEVAGAIRYGTDRLNRLVAGLFNISLVERERFFISKHREDIVSLVEQAVGEMRVQVPARRFNVSAAEEVMEGDIDPVRIHSLLIILLDNAVKYSPQSTEIDVTMEAKRGEVLVSVLDRGMGVSSEHEDKIFKRFYQVEEAQYHSKPGLGLGLFLARQIVEGHGGRIWYEPREGGGGAFRFTLPVS